MMYLLEQLPFHSLESTFLLRGMAGGPHAPCRTQVALGELHVSITARDDDTRGQIKFYWKTEEGEPRKMMMSITTE
jgi:hypothetical protein